MKNKIITISLVIIILAWILLWLSYKRKNDETSSQKDGIETENANRDKAEMLIDEWKFDEVQKYYDDLLKTALTPDEKMMYLVRKAYVYFLEWESSNKQNEFFIKWKKLLDGIGEEQWKNYPEYYRVLGFWYEINRKYRYALKNYLKALDLAEWDSTLTVQILWGIAHTYMLEGNPYEALKYLSKAIKIDDSDIFVNRLLFRTLGMLSRYDEAIKTGEDLIPKITNKEDLWELYYSLSSMAFLKEDLKKSLDYAQECIKLKPNYGFCHLSLAKVYFYWWQDKNSKSLAEIEAKKAFSFDPNSSIILEFIALLKEASGDTNKAIFNHTNNLKYFIDSDTNLFDNEKVVAKQRTMIHLVRLHSKKQEKNNSIYYLGELLKSPINYQNLAILEQEIIKKWSDFSYVLKNADLSDYLGYWKSKTNFYKHILQTCRNGDNDCISAHLYEKINDIVLVKKEFRKIDLWSLVKIMAVKESCKKDNSSLDDSLKSMCLIFTTSHDYLLSSNKSNNKDAKSIFK